MFKKKNTMCKSNFKKLYIKSKIIKPINNWLFFKNKIIISKKKLILLIKSLRKFTKKNKTKILFVPKVNLIKSFKSKNARMGNGKGQLKKNIIRNLRRELCIIKKISLKKLTLLKKKILTNYWSI